MIGRTATAGCAVHNDQALAGGAQFGYVPRIQGISGRLQDASRHEARARDAHRFEFRMFAHVKEQEAFFCPQLPEQGQRRNGLRAQLRSADEISQCHRSLRMKRAVNWPRLLDASGIWCASLVSSEGSGTAQG